MTVRIAFVGFRHGHILGLHELANQRNDIEIVGCCEKDPQTRMQLEQQGQVKLTHQDSTSMLQEVDCNVIAVGEYYAGRGEILIEAMKAGKHVIADKPICTSLEELKQIESLAASQGLSVGCMLDMPDIGQFQTVRRLIQEGRIGEIHAISFDGQHPLNYGTRPGWYFEQGKHGGTINDIAIHALDFIPWATGLEFTAINAARNWNALLKQVPFFKDSAQLMMTMNNGCGVLGDVSYLAPDSMGYSIPQYWRLTIWGQGGVIETSATMDQVIIYQSGQTQPQQLKPDEPRRGGYLDDYLAEIQGHPSSDGLTTARAIRSSRIALRVQEAADKGLANVNL